MGKDHWIKVLNSLANRVEIRLYLNSGIPDAAIEEVKHIAHNLDIPELSITEWANNRKEQASDIRQDIKALLSTLENNPSTRSIFKHSAPYESTRYDKDDLN